MNAQDMADKKAEKKRIEDKRVEDDKVVLVPHTPPRPLHAGELQGSATITITLRTPERPQLLAGPLSLSAEMELLLLTAPVRLLNSEF